MASLLALVLSSRSLSILKKIPKSRNGEVRAQRQIPPSSEQRRHNAVGEIRDDPRPRNPITVNVFFLSPSISGCCLAGELKLNPVQEQITRLAGEENSFFISCSPESSTGGPVGDSRVRAKELRWTKLRAPPAGDGTWVTMGTEAHERWDLPAPTF